MTALIALDWGTSALRAYRFAANGTVTARRELPYGIMKLPDTPDRLMSFRLAFDRACADWLATDPACPIIASGMIGSAQGWQGAPYLSAPCDARQLAEQLTRVNVDDQRCFYIIPGVQQTDLLPEVMRGEETQVFGAIVGDERLFDVQANGRESLIALPGTHSKWVSVSHGKIERLRTFMSGEFYDVLRHHSILGLTMQPPEEPDWQAFAEGIRVACHQPGNLLGSLFSVRTRLLCQQLTPQQQPDYLSGLLLGNELATALNGISADTDITLIGSAPLCQRYQRAMAIFECRNSVYIAPGAAEQGMWQIARYASLVA
ncbi:2-dehydro-3-deoxygalactonokinase [Klebsiella oxytoca]